MVLFADCCRYPVEGAGRAAAAFDDYRAAAARSTTSAVTPHCSATPPLNRHRPIPRGYFTAALLAGLNGEAAPAGQPIDGLALQAYVERRVPVLTAAVKGGPQEPQFELSGKANPVILVPQSPGQVAHPIQITFNPYEGPVQLLGARGQRVPGTEVFPARPEAKWDLKLTQGRYCVAPAGPAVAGTLKNNGDFDFTGPPPGGGTHVQKI